MYRLLVGAERATYVKDRRTYSNQVEVGHRVESSNRIAMVGGDGDHYQQISSMDLPQASGPIYG